MKEAVFRSIKEKVNHQYVELVNRGNAAILVSLLKTANKVFSPAEGGWLTYKRYSENLGKEFIEIKTNEAVIDLDDLKEKLTSNCVFIYHSLGGYFAKNNIQEIYNICKEKNVLVIMDVSGSYATPLCNGIFADICLGSFGKWKLVDLGQGGFISFKNKNLYELYKPLLSAFTFQGDTKELLHKLSAVGERINYLLEKRNQVTKDLTGEGFKVLGKDNKFSFVVIVSFQNETDRTKIIEYCTKNNLEYTTCPREIRVMQDAISIEIKRLETS